MILIDFNNQMNILFSVAVKYTMADKYKNQGKLNKEIKPEPSELENLRRGYLTSMIKLIHTLKTRHSRNYGTVVLAVDSPNNWRKMIYPAYKQNRSDKAKDRNTYEEFLSKQMFALSDEVLELASKMVNVISLDNIKLKGKYGVEGDDIIGTLVLAHLKDKHLIVSNDGDFKQLISQTVRIYDTKIEKIQPPLTKKLQVEFILTTLLQGQSKDNIPNIKKDTMLHPDFVLYFNKHNEDDIELTETDIDKEYLFKQLGEKWVDIKDKEEEKAVKDGKKVRLKKWTIYKPMQFGKVAVKEFMSGYEKKLKEYEPWQLNYERNKRLILFTEIPDVIQKYILKMYIQELDKPTLGSMQLMKQKNELMKEGYSFLVEYM